MSSGHPESPKPQWTGELVYPLLFYKLMAGRAQQSSAIKYVLGGLNYT